MMHRDLSTQVAMGVWTGEDGLRARPLMARGQLKQVTYAVIQISNKRRTGDPIDEDGELAIVDWGKVLPNRLNDLAIEES
jgi:hypothetical protein